MIRRGRLWHCKASPAIAEEIRGLSSAGVLQTVIAARFGLSKHTVGRIVRGQHWRPATTEREGAGDATD
jgi:hypothetical protein